MACIQYPRKNRGGISLGSWEQPTIYKEPLKEVFTKKKERIEEGDVTYNIRNDPSRYNDAITNDIQTYNLKSLEQVIIKAKNKMLPDIDLVIKESWTNFSQMY